MLPSGEVLFIGGTGPTMIRPGHLSVGSVAWVDAYQPATEQWQALGRLPAGRSGHTATLLAGGRTLVAGEISCSPNLAQTYLASTILIDRGVEAERSRETPSEGGLHD